MRNKTAIAQSLRENATLSTAGDYIVPKPVDTGSNKRAADVHHKHTGVAKIETSATPVPELKGSTDKPTRPADKKPPQGDEVADIPKTKAGVIADLVSRIAKKKRVEIIDAHGNILKALGEDIDDSDPVGVGSIVAEDLQAMFEGTELSEEFQAKATALFEAAVNVRVATEVAAIDERLTERYAEMFQEHVAETDRNVDAYLNEAVAEWINQNQLAVESGIRAELSESFINGLKKLFAEHYVEIPDDKVDMVEELAAQVETMETQLEQNHTLITKLTAAVEDSAKREIVREAAVGLTATQADRLNTMVEGISSVGLDDYQARVEAIRESLIDGNKAVVRQTTVVSESEESSDDDETTIAESADPVMRRYAAALSRLQAKI